MFGSKKTPIKQSEESLINKNPLWQFFIVSEKDKSKAVCQLCGSTLSLGNVLPKFQATTYIKNHLKAKHQNEFLRYTKILEDSKSSQEKRKREFDCESIQSSLKNKKQKTEIFQQTIPSYVESVKVLDIKHPKALEMHKNIFEFIVEDMQPFSIVDDRGFVR